MCGGVGRWGCLMCTGCCSRSRSGGLCDGGRGRSRADRTLRGRAAAMRAGQRVMKGPSGSMAASAVGRRWGWRRRWVRIGCVRVLVQDVLDGRRATGIWGEVQCGLCHSDEGASSSSSSAVGVRSALVLVPSVLVLGVLGVQCATGAWARLGAVRCGGYAPQESVRAGNATTREGR